MHCVLGYMDEQTRQLRSTEKYTCTCTVYIEGTYAEDNYLDIHTYTTCTVYRGHVNGICKVYMALV